MAKRNHRVENVYVKDNASDRTIGPVDKATAAKIVAATQKTEVTKVVPKR